MKRFIDLIVSLVVLLLLSPLLILVMILVWLQDFHSPFYIAPRSSKGDGSFNMVKFRSMIVKADQTGVDSTSDNDNRITPIGKLIRKIKLDEISQLWNVLKGDMSLVGPRPNVKSETDLYTKVEKKLLSVTPGITDLSSIIFSDEGDILSKSLDPDLDYNQLIRPWKSRLGLIYIENQNHILDLKILIFTAIGFFNREKTLKLIVNELKKINVDSRVIEVASRVKPLIPEAPPGQEDIVTKR
jgi:lipopolysaccharide/colanic/teichoic acid biosynthesis glycosyltransferase